MNWYYFSQDWIDRMEGLFKNPRNTYEVKLWENGNLVYDSQKENKTTKPNNNAPKSIKGDYDLSIHGNKIVLVDNKDGTTVETRCHPDDEFDIGVGVKEAFKKLNTKRREELRKQKEEEEKKIKVGDWVEVIRSFATYPLYTNFFEENNLYSYGKIFRYGTTVKEGTKGKVVFVSNGYIVIQCKENFGCYGDRDFTYLVSEYAIRKVAKPNV